MSLSLYQIDAFTREPFSGNPAAVCLLERPASEERMQKVAREMNLSETAFMVQRQEPDAFDLRWFTPTTEVELCGHATLASAHWLYERETAAAGARISFHTASGVLHAERDGELLWLDFPSEKPSTASTPDGLYEALGGEEPVSVGRSRRDLFVRLEDEEMVRSLSPDLSALARIDARGVIVTAPGASDGADFVSRFFAPRAGVPEDPVTGSAHCALAPYWAEELGRNALTGRQLSDRGGTVHVRAKGNRVALGGHAVTVLRATLLV